jgi:hypothetical protein
MLPMLHGLLSSKAGIVPPAEAEAPTGFLTGDTLIESSTSTLTPARPVGGGDGTYYAWIMHRDTLTLPAGWEEVATQFVGNQELNQALTVAKAPASVTNMTFTQASAQRFLGVVLETIGGSDWIETITSQDGINVNGWHVGSTITPPGKGIVMSGSCSTLANTSGATEYMSTLPRITPYDVDDNRLCVATGNVVKNNEVTPEFYSEPSNTELAEISITLTDNSETPEEFSTIPFITRWKAGAFGEDFIVLPLVSGGNYDFWVDWGFGVVDHITSYDDAKNSFPFADSSTPTYDVKIYGECDRWQFGSVSAARDSFKDVIQWGDVEWSTCFEMFNNVDFGVDVLTATDIPNTTNVTDFSYMFAQSNGLTVAPDLDMGQALNASNMFYLSDIEQTPYYNTALCQDFGYMFYGLNNLSGFGGLDTSSAIETNDMFFDCEGLTSVNINTTTVENFSGMFANNASIIDCGTLDIGNNGSTILNVFNNTINLTTFRILNANSELQLEDTAVTWATISQLWDDLPVVSGELYHRINIQGTPAVSDPNYDPQPAIDKGWTVTDA